jgi:cation transport regulator ChaC
MFHAALAKSGKKSSKKVAEKAAKKWQKSGTKWQKLQHTLHELSSTKMCSKGI